MSAETKALIRSQGDELPEPEPREGLEWIWIAFHRLARDRPYLSAGMAGAFPGTIPWRDVAAYATFHGIDQGSYRVMDYCIMQMDAVWIEHWHETRPKPKGT